jgi:hypothetical protein
VFPVLLILSCLDCPVDSIPADSVRAWLLQKEPVAQLGWAMVTANRFRLTLCPLDTVSAEPETLWVETRRGTIDRLHDPTIWNDPPPEWPAYYWNPPPEHELRYPVQIHHPDGTIEYPPTNEGDSTVVIPPGESAIPVLPEIAGQATSVRL